ncbi:helix-turn-helix domain-containing protein, partial [Rhizobium rhizogenes]|uniref:helix-turn-helix domain-containing protein n=1 Tax=Rhizobium rhizogenes TaxID=359 RepID=UPI001F2670C1
LASVNQTDKLTQPATQDSHPDCRAPLIQIAAPQIDRSYVGRVERGGENVTVATLEAFAKVLSVNVSELFAEIAPEDTKPPGLPSGRKQKGL